MNEMDIAQVERLLNSLTQMRHRKRWKCMGKLLMVSHCMLIFKDTRIDDAIELHVALLCYVLMYVRGKGSMFCWCFI